MFVGLNLLIAQLLVGMGLSCLHLRLQHQMMWSVAASVTYQMNGEFEMLHILFLFFYYLAFLQPEGQ
jgi:hypothetical protein